MMFAARRFLKDFAPSAAAIVEAIAEYGFAPPVARSVYQWSLRGSIPSQYLLAILFIRELEQRPASIIEYMRGQT